MMKAQKKGADSEVPKLTIEEIDTQESFRHLSMEEKLALISFVHELATILYNSYCHGDE